MRYGAAAIAQPLPPRVFDDYYGGPRCCGVRRQRGLLRLALVGLLVTAAILYFAEAGDRGGGQYEGGGDGASAAASLADTAPAPPAPAAAECAHTTEVADASARVGVLGEQLAAARTALAAAQSDLLASMAEAGTLRDELQAAKAEARAAAAGQPEPPSPEVCPPPPPHVPPPPCPACPPPPPAPPPCPSQTPAPEQAAFAPQLPATQQAVGHDAATLLYTPGGHAHDAADALGLPDSGLAPGTRAAQRALAAHQFPAGGCGGRRRFLTSTYVSGLGSMLHVATYHLAVAVATGRVFLWHASAGGVYTDDATCPGTPNFECFVARPSNCTLADAVAAGADILALDSEQPVPEAGGADHTLVPPAFRAIYEAALARSGGGGAPVTADQLKLWWRSQAAAFLLRLNGRTVDALRALRTRSRALVAAAGGATAPTTATAPLDGGTPGDGWARALTRSFPLPRGVVSMHVRHGDKGVEMPLVPAVDYMWAAESRLVALNPLSLVRGAFVSTEDPGVLDDAVAVTRGAFEGLPPGNPLARWGFVWSDIPRHNACGEEQLSLIGAPRGQTTRLWLLQLLLALECDAWVGTRGSNWNRLIDELRCVWVPKCGYPYVEVGADGSWAGYGWRRRRLTEGAAQQGNTSRAGMTAAVGSPPSPLEEAER